MTHDDLMKGLKALLAVLELHKPYQHEVVGYVFCKGCTIDLDLAPPYPCETIQAIEKELE
jgi:Pyruvate/2-oxoacid:ferredoxin oxidoreductase delta subunit